VGTTAAVPTVSQEMTVVIGEGAKMIYGIVVSKI
jgi:hypothetical protein